MYSLSTVIGGVPLDGRRFDKQRAEETMMHCLDRLKNNTFDGVDQWLLELLIEKNLGISEAVLCAVEQQQGANLNYVKGLLLFHGVGHCVPRDEKEAIRLWTEGTTMKKSSSSPLTAAAGPVQCQLQLGWVFLWGCSAAAVPRDTQRAIELIGAGNFASLALCYQYGEGVTVDEYSAMRLYHLQHEQGHVAATYKMGQFYCQNVPYLKLAYLHLAAARGHPDANEQLVRLQRRSDSKAIPFGCWSPRAHIHKWVSDSIDNQMVTLLIAKGRADCLFGKLPRDVVLFICFYICCRPYRRLPRKQKQTSSPGQTNAHHKAQKRQRGA